jgi:hypothetical protein
MRCRVKNDQNNIFVLQAPHVHAGRVQSMELAGRPRRVDEIVVEDELPSSWDKTKRG